MDWNELYAFNESRVGVFVPIIENKLQGQAA